MADASTSTALAAPATSAPAKPTIGSRLKAVPLGAKLAAGAGVATLAVVGAPALLPIALGYAALAAFYKVRGKGKMTEERRLTYEALLKNQRDTAKLRTMADVFAKEGNAPEALMLRLHANLHDIPSNDPKKVAYREAYAKAIAVTDPAKAPDIVKLADAFEKTGAVGAAADLRTYAGTLTARAAA